MFPQGDEANTALQTTRPLQLFVVTRKYNKYTTSLAVNKATELLMIVLALAI